MHIVFDIPSIYERCHLQEKGQPISFVQGWEIHYYQCIWGNWRYIWWVPTRQRDWSTQARCMDFSSQDNLKHNELVGVKENWRMYVRTNMSLGRTFTWTKRYASQQGREAWDTTIVKLFISKHWVVYEFHIRNKQGEELMAIFVGRGSCKVEYLSMCRVTCYFGTQ